MREVCGFLGEQFTPEMLRDRDSSSAGNAQERRFWDTSIGRYRRDLSKQQIAWVQAVGGAAMARFGYEREPTAVGAVDRLRLWTLEVPLHSLMLLLWRLREVVKRIRGGRPSDRRLVT